MNKCEKEHKITVADTPNLIEQWDFEKNQGIDLRAITLGSGKKVWWKCNQGHEWEASISHRANGRGCPYCSHEKAWPGETDLATQFPNIAKQWDVEENIDLTPSKVLPRSNKKSVVDLRERT